MKPERQSEPPIRVSSVLSPIERLRRLGRDVRRLGFRFGFRHWRLQNHIDNQRAWRLWVCVRRLGWRFGLQYWRMGGGLKSPAEKSRRFPVRAEGRLAGLTEKVRRLERSELGDRTSRA